MKKQFLLFGAGFFWLMPSFAQQKITDGITTLPNSNAILELESSNKGLLMPRLALTATSNAAPLVAHVSGMTIYNTATAGAGITAVTPGFYYNDGTQWVKLASAASATDNQQLSLNTTNNILTLEDGGSVNLTPYLDNTDNQQISLSNNILTLTNGGTVNLTQYLDNSDNQQIQAFSLNGATNVLTLTLEDGGTQTVDLSSLKAEPWQVQGGTDKATLNTENIYQMGSVAVKKTTAATGVSLDIEGSVRGGTNHGGTTGANSVAFGNTNVASGANSAAFGLRNTSSGPQSTTFGTDNTASGSRATAFGTLNVANGPYATVFGSTNTGSGFHSVTFGGGNTNSASFQMVAGTNNAITTGDNTIFQIGNGNPNVPTDRSNAITVLKNGYTGIGNAANNPTERLDIAGGNVRVRDINTNTGTAADNVVVADANGVLKTVAATSIGSAIRTETTNYSAVVADETILADASAALVTITLPATAPTGKKYYIKKIDNSANQVVINGNGANVEGSPTLAINNPYKCSLIQFNGTNWYIIGQY